MSEKFHYIVEDAMKLYAIDPIGIEFLCEETNVFYLVYTSSSKVVLKIFQEESSKLEDNLIEMYLLEQITLKSDIIVPKVIQTKKGEHIGFVYDSKDNINKRVALYEFLEGEDIDQIETVDLICKLGKETAKLHNLTKTLSIPKDMHPKKWDKVFYYRDEEVLYNQERYKHYFGDENVKFLDQLIAFVNEKLSSFYNKESFLIHADLNPWNVKVFDEEIRLFDFEEGMIGSFIHEFAIFLFYYKYDNRDVYNAFKNAFLKGYEEVSGPTSYNEFDIEILMLARRLNFLNYILMISDDPTGYIHLNLKRVKETVFSLNINLDKNNDSFGV